MFGGIKIDPQQMMQQQQNMQTCTAHPECVGCPLYNMQGLNGTVCENALVKLSQNNQKTDGQSSV